MKVSIVGSLRDREVACSASDRQGSNFESCVWRTVSSQSSHHPQEVLLAQFSLYVHKGGLKPDSFHFISFSNIVNCPMHTIKDGVLPSTFRHCKIYRKNDIYIRVNHHVTAQCSIFYSQAFNCVQRNTVDFTARHCNCHCKVL